MQSNHLRQIPLEKRIKPILDRIHLLRDLINRAEYEEKCVPSDEECERVLRIKELPPIQSDLNPICLQKNQKPIIFLIGGPNTVPKDMAKMIGQKYLLTVISVGKLIEKEIKEGTPIGRFIEPTVREGDLVKPDIVVWLLQREMLTQYRCSKGYVIEGFPRTKEQLVQFENEVARAHIAVFLHVDNATLEEMFLSPGMIGKKRDNLSLRVCNYQKYTAPLKNEFGKRCKIIHGVGRAAWKFLDEVLAKMMLEWCFLKEDVTGMEDLHCGEPVQINYYNLLVPRPRRDKNNKSGERMFEMLGGVIPYFVQRDCTRKPLGFPDYGVY